MTFPTFEPATQDYGTFQTLHATAACLESCPLARVPEATRAYETALTAWNDGDQNAPDLAREAYRLSEFHRRG